MKIVANESDKAATLALTRMCAVLCLKLMGDRIKDIKSSVVDPDYRKILNFLAQYSDDTKPFTECYNNMLKKSDTVEPYAKAFVAYLRAILNKNNIKNNINILSSNTRTVLNPCLTLMADPDRDTAFSTFTNISKNISYLQNGELTRAYVNLYGQLAAQKNAEPNTAKPDGNKPVGDKPKILTPVSLKRSETPSVPEGNAAQTINNIIRSLKELGKRITGRNDVTQLTPEDRAQFGEDPQKVPLLKEFNKLRKQLNDVKINEIRAIVTASGKNVLPIKDVVKALKARGIKQIVLPPGLLDSHIVYMNIDGKLCDSEGRIAIKQGYNYPNAAFEHNTKYQHGSSRNNWLFRVLTTTPQGKVTKNYVQTEDKVSQNRAARFDKVDQILENGIENAKETWRSSMGGNSDDEQTVFANIAEYMFWTASRIGSGEGETAGARTYGASNFLVRHIKNLPKTKGSIPTQLNISYPIKSGATDEFTLSSNVRDLPTKNDATYCKQLIRFIVEKAQGKKPDDVVFTVKNKPVNTNRLNSFLRNLIGGTAKDFRTLRGTELADYALKEARKEFAKLKKQAKNGKVPNSTVNQLFDAAMSNVGELLGHVRNTDEGEKITPNTAIRSYVNPKIMVSFFTDLGYAPPQKVVKAAQTAGIKV